MHNHTSIRRLTKKVQKMLAVDNKVKKKVQRTLAVNDKVNNKSPADAGG